VNKLEKLSLRFNRLVELHKKTFVHLTKSLKILDLGFNDFQQLPNALEHLSSIEELSLQNNRIQT
jgi:Leucine-rich repeat (LRR) protein